MRVERILNETENLTLKTGAINKLVNHVFHPFTNKIEKDLKNLIEKNASKGLKEDISLAESLDPFAFIDPVTNKIEGAADPMFTPPELKEEFQEEYKKICAERIQVDNDIRVVRKYLKAVLARCRHTSQVEPFLPPCLKEPYSTVFTIEGWFEKPSAFNPLKPITSGQIEDLNAKFKEAIELINAREGMKVLLGLSE